MKIYNKIIIEWNDETQSYDKVVYEDSYEYDGELMLASDARDDPWEGCPHADIDSIDYRWVIIGDQCWLANNLETTVYNDGTSIEDGASLNDWISFNAAGAGAYARNPELEANYPWGGYHYNWYAVTDPRGICPVDVYVEPDEQWHIPSHDEWTELERYVCIEHTGNSEAACINAFPYNTSETGWQGGGSTTIREYGSADEEPTDWTCPDSFYNDECFEGTEATTCGPNGEYTCWESKWRNPDAENETGTDISNFTALPASIRETDGDWQDDNIGSRAFFWSSEDHDGARAWYRYLSFNKREIYRGRYYYAHGLSARCVSPTIDIWYFDLYANLADAGNRVTGTITGDVAVESWHDYYPADTTIIVTAVPVDGYYVFINWTDGAGNELSTDIEYTHTLDADIQLYANFNGIPIATDSSIETNEDTNIAFDLIAEDPDPDEVLSYHILSLPSNGTLYEQAGNEAEIGQEYSTSNFTYAPALNFNGDDSFTFKVIDIDGSNTYSNDATVSITVVLVVDEVTIDAIDDQTIDEDTVLTYDVVYDYEGSDPLTWSAESDDPAVATSIVYHHLEVTPDPNWFGTATITVTAEPPAGEGSAVSESFTLTVESINDPPVLAEIGARTIDEDQYPAGYDIDLSVSNVEGEDSTITVESGNANVTAELINTTLRLTPAEHFNTSLTGPIDITVGVGEYCTCGISPSPRGGDGYGGKLSKRLRRDILDTVYNVPSELVECNSTREGKQCRDASIDWQSWEEMSPIDYPHPATRPQVIREECCGWNCLELNGSTACDCVILCEDVFASSDDDPEGVCAEDGVTPCDPDSQLKMNCPSPLLFCYDEEVFPLTITPVAEPTADLDCTDQSIQIFEGTVVQFDNAAFPQLSCTDPPGPEEIQQGDWEITAYPSYGTLSSVTGCYGPNCGVTYTPATDFFGDDEFKYRTTTSEGGTSQEGIISINVQQLYLTPPICLDITASTAEDIAQSISLNCTAQPVGTYTDPISYYAIVSNPSHGIVALDSTTGIVTYEPTPDWNSGEDGLNTDSFTYHACTSGDACSEEATVEITVNPVNDPPIAVPQCSNCTANEIIGDFVPGHTEAVNLVGSNSIDIDSLITSFVWKKGEDIINEDGAPDFTEQLGIGSHELTLTVTDDEGLSEDPGVSVATLLITITSNEYLVTANIAISADESTIHPGQGHIEFGTISDGTNSGGTVVPYSYSHPYGTEVSLLAESVGDHSFEDWEGSITDNPLVITVTENVTYTANFTPEPYTPPSTSFTTDLDGGYRDLTVSFTDGSEGGETDATITTWVWNFDDSCIATVVYNGGAYDVTEDGACTGTPTWDNQNPTYTYTTTNTTGYQPSLTVIDSYLQSGTSQHAGIIVATPLSISVDNDAPEMDEDEGSVTVNLTVEGDGPPTITTSWIETIEGIAVGGYTDSVLNINMYNASFDGAGPGEVQFQPNEFAFIHPDGTIHDVDQGSGTVSDMEDDGTTTSDSLAAYLVFVGTDETRFTMNNVNYNKTFIVAYWDGVAWTYDDNTGYSATRYPTGTFPLPEDAIAARLYRDSEQSPGIESADHYYLPLENPENDNVDVSLTGMALTLTPSADWFGTAVITVWIVDEHEATYDWSNPISLPITLTVESINDPPTAIDNDFSVGENTNLSMTITGAADIEGDTLTYFIMSGTVHGSLWEGEGVPDTPDWDITNDISGDLAAGTLGTYPIGLQTLPDDTTGDQIGLNDLQYWPDLDWNSGEDGSNTDSFTYKVCDDELCSAAATVTITVTPTNSPPVLIGIDGQETNEDIPLSITLSATDPDTETLIFTSESDTLGLVTTTIVGDELTMYPVLHQFGDAIITVGVGEYCDPCTAGFCDDDTTTCDGGLKTNCSGETPAGVWPCYDEIDFTLEVLSVNDPPEADAGDDQTVDGNVTVTLDGTGSTDPEGDTLYYAWSGELAGYLNSTTAAQPTFTAPRLADPVAAFTAERQLGNYDDFAVPMEVQFTDTTSFDGGTLTYSWNFGDSGTSSAQSPLYIYTDAGNYSVTLTVSTSTSDSYNFELVVNDGELDSEESDDVDITVNNSYLDISEVEIITADPHLPPNAVLDTDDIDFLAVKAEATDVNTPTSGTTGEVTIYRFDFGDGCIASDINEVYDWEGTCNSGTTPGCGVGCFTHQYDTDGTVDYTVTLTVIDELGAPYAEADEQIPPSYFSTYTESVTVEAIDVDFSIDSGFGLPPLTVQFTDQSELPDGGGLLGIERTITNWEWDFGDGTPIITGPDPNPIHTYLDIGIYTVTLTVTSDDGYEVSEVKSDFIEVSLVQSVSGQYAPWRGFNITGTADNTLSYADTWDLDPRPRLGTFYWDDQQPGYEEQYVGWPDIYNDLRQYGFPEAGGEVPADWLTLICWSPSVPAHVTDRDKYCYYEGQDCAYGHDWCTNGCQCRYLNGWAERIWEYIPDAGIESFSPDVDARSAISIENGVDISLFSYYDKKISPAEYTYTTAPANVQFMFYLREFGIVFEERAHKSITDPAGDGSVDYSYRFYIAWINWDDGSPLEYETPVLLKGNEKILHSFENWGVYNITGYIIYADDDALLNSNLYFKKFFLNINLNKSIGYTDEFETVGGNDHTYIPYDDTTPVIGGISDNSLYYKTVEKIADGFVDGDGSSYMDRRDELRSQIAFNNIDDRLIGPELLQFTGSYNVGAAEIYNDEPTVEFQTGELKGFFQGEVQSDGSVTNEELIHHGYGGTAQELGDHLGDVDIGQARLFKTPLSMWEMLGFPPDPVSVNGTWITSDGDYRCNDYWYSGDDTGDCQAFCHWGICRGGPYDGESAGDPYCENGDPACQESKAVCEEVSGCNSVWHPLCNGSSGTTNQPESNAACRDPDNTEPPGVNYCTPCVRPGVPLKYHQVGGYAVAPTNYFLYAVIPDGIDWNNTEVVPDLWETYCGENSADLCTILRDGGTDHFGSLTLGNVFMSETNHGNEFSTHPDANPTAVYADYDNVGQYLEFFNDTSGIRFIAERVWEGSPFYADDDGVFKIVYCYPGGCPGDTRNSEGVPQNMNLQVRFDLENVGEEISLSNIPAGNPGAAQYWKNIIPERYLLSDREGVTMDGDEITDIDPDNAQQWKFGMEPHDSRNVINDPYFVALEEQLDGTGNIANSWAIETGFSNDCTGGASVIPTMYDNGPGLHVHIQIDANTCTGDTWQFLGYSAVEDHDSLATFAEGGTEYFWSFDIRINTLPTDIFRENKLVFRASNYTNDSGANGDLVKGFDRKYALWHSGVHDTGEWIHVETTRVLVSDYDTGTSGQCQDGCAGYPRFEIYTNTPCPDGGCNSGTPDNPAAIWDYDIKNVVMTELTEISPYYPVLPRVNKFGEFDYTRLGLQNSNTPFGSPDREWDGDDETASITNLDLENSDLIIDFDFSSISNGVLGDNSGNENLGILLNDFKVKLDSDVHPQSIKFPNRAKLEKKSREQSF